MSTTQPAWEVCTALLAFLFPHLPQNDTIPQRMACHTTLNREVLRTFMFYQFREWKLPELPYEVSIPALCTYRMKQVPAGHLAHFFSFDLFQCTAKPQNRGRESRNKIEFDHYRVKTNTKAFYGWQSKVIFGN